MESNLVCNDTSDKQIGLVQLVDHEYDYRQNWTTQSVTNKSKPIQFPGKILLEQISLMETMSKLKNFSFLEIPHFFLG